MTSLADDVLARHVQAVGQSFRASKPYCVYCGPDHGPSWPCDAARAATALAAAQATLDTVAAERDALRRVAKAAQRVERAFAAYWKGDGVQGFDRLSNRMVELAVLAAASPAEKET